MTVEQQLRAALRGETGSVTGWPDPVSRIERGVGRRKRRRLAAQAVAAATVLVTVLTVGLVSGEGPETPAIVDATVDDSAGVPSIQRRSPRPDRPPCRPERLNDPEWVVQSAPWGLSTGFAVEPLGLERCTLTGRPQLFGVDVATGLRVEVPFAAEAGSPSGRVRQFPATLDPGEPARVEIRGSSTGCPSGQSPRSYRDLSLLVGGRELALPGFRTLSSVCGAHVSDWFVEPPMLYASLKANLEAPKTLRRGEEFSYSVRILNAYPKKFSFSACPVYSLGVGADGQGWRHLACGISSIGPHRSVSFQMTGRLPADTPTGRALLTWMAVLPNGEVIVADMMTSGYPVTVTD